MAQHPTDMRMGVNRLSGQGQIGRTGSFERRRLYFCGQILHAVMKILHWGARRIRGLLQAALKRVAFTAFSCARRGFRSMRWSELVL